MCWLMLHRGNMNLGGSTPAEQNHSSIKVALGGEASTLSLVENVRKLLERDSRRATEKAELRNRLYLFSDRYKSEFTGFQNKADVDAKKTLSDFAYKKFKNFLRWSITKSSHVSSDGFIHCYDAGQRGSSWTVKWKKGD